MAKRCKIPPKQGKYNYLKSEHQKERKSFIQYIEHPKSNNRRSQEQTKKEKKKKQYKTI